MIFFFFNIDSQKRQKVMISPIVDVKTKGVTPSYNNELNRCQLRGQTVSSILNSQPTVTFSLFFNFQGMVD